MILARAGVDGNIKNAAGKINRARSWILDFGLGILDYKKTQICKRSQVQGSTFKVRDKDKIEGPKSP